MSAQEVVPLAISALALGISVYGIFERRNAAYAALRVRITELVDRLGALGVEEQEYRYAHRDMPYDETRSVVGSIQSRRLVPTYQAIALLERLRSAARLPFSPPVRLTPQEHTALAESLSVLRDLEPARAQWEEAATAAGNASPMVRAAVYHGYAGALFALGEASAGRAAFRTAIENYPDTEAGRWDRFNNYVDWLEEERALDDGEPDEPLRGAQRLAAEPTFWQAGARERLDETDLPEGKPALGDP
jgi:tetratricopeptide (TPR) repeat protein